MTFPVKESDGQIMGLVGPSKKLVSYWKGFPEGCHIDTNESSSAFEALFRSEFVFFAARTKSTRPTIMTTNGSEDQMIHVNLWTHSISGSFETSSWRPRMG